jgi:hypothetical protein
MTYRLPFQSYVRVTHPDLIAPMSRPDIVEHEMYHVTQFESWWGPWLIPLAASLFPLPVLLSGRWFIERWAYLGDIKAGRLTVEAAAETLWGLYGWCWPKPLMRRWFRGEL